VPRRHRESVTATAALPAAPRSQVLRSRRGPESESAIDRTVPALGREPDVFRRVCKHLPLSDLAWGPEGQGVAGLWLYVDLKYLLVDTECESTMNFGTVVDEPRSIDL
jgi:hypothetical protein